MTEYIVVLITAPNDDDAGRIGHSLVEEKLAGCVNIIRSVRSIYRWKGSIEDEPEVLLIIKTKRSLFERLTQRVSELHRYSVPEIIAVPLVEGNERYLAWLGQETA